jgi:tetratricopeptide (TPR) repeat protein
MPSHIFIQLGMWPEAAASNESSWATSVEWVKRKNYPITRRDYHSLHWLTYVYLQQGRFAKAAELIAQMQSDIRQSAEVRQRGYMPMAAAYVVETGRWAEAARLFNEEERKDQKAAGDGHAGHAPAATQQNQSPAYSNRPRGSSLPVFVRAMAAISTGAQAEAERFLAELKAMRQEAERENSYRAKIIGIMELEVAALASSARGNQDEAIELMKKATALEEDMSPPSGPPDVIKPSHELFGEILLKARRPAEAAQQFATSLARQPNRARSLLGAARAAAQSGDQQGAAAAYAKFLEIWRQADADLSELDEARAFMSQASSR